jgi:hypothetical protein
MKNEDIGKLILGIIILGVAFKLVLVLIPWALKFFYYGLIVVGILAVGKVLRDKGVF